MGGIQCVWSELLLNSLPGEPRGQITPDLRPLFIRGHALDAVEVCAPVEMGALDCGADIGGDGLGAADEVAYGTMRCSRWMTELCNTPRGGKDGTVTSSFVLVGGYFYPACVADVVRRAGNRTRKASP